jgi:hypothetical protein
MVRQALIGELQDPRNEPGSADFVAIARPNLGLGCKIDMDMLVNHQPGSIITHAGDLDNRIKTLFDALRVPRGKDQIKHYQPMTSCCYCLMCGTASDRDPTADSV